MNEAVKMQVGEEHLTTSLNLYYFQDTQNVHIIFFVGIFNQKNMLVTFNL